eukprot:TRINITY_DN1859_c0_g1_i1.p1 TRINITY_DN1859_c0_g1~~TRINITY_DN1859_c0_g1_i1.p1  ORF type:complete len:409 (+),score=43.50 TRINITY_DN1859_c0_g1_i1:84-1229(+)
MPQSARVSRTSSPRAGAGSPRSPRIAHTAHSAARSETARLRGRLEQSERSLAHMEACLQQKDRQLHSAEAAASWATGQLEQLMAALNGALRLLGTLHAGGNAARQGTPSRARRIESATTAGRDATQRALGDLCAAAASSAARAREVADKVGALDGDRRMRQLQAQVHRLERIREQQGSELRRMGDEISRLTERAGSGRPIYREGHRHGGVTVMPPQVVRMPSLPEHGCSSSDHWPVRSIGTQTLRVASDGHVPWGSPSSSRAASPLRSWARVSCTSSAPGGADLARPLQAAERELTRLRAELRAAQAQRPPPEEVGYPLPSLRSPHREPSPTRPPASALGANPVAPHSDFGRFLAAEFGSPAAPLATFPEGGGVGRFRAAR